MNYEYIILRKENVNLFKLPSMSTTKEIYLNSWKEQIWRGNLEIKGKGKQCWLELINFDNNLYARTFPNKDFRNIIQKCIDSSRGYAIKLENENGKSAWVGLLFHDRNDAFDFFATFEEFERKNAIKENTSNNILNQDFSIKPGEKLILGDNNDFLDNNNLNNNDFSKFSIMNPDTNEKPENKEKNDFLSFI